MKAIKMVQTNITVKKRAAEYVKSIKRNIQKKVIDKLTEQIERIDDNLFSELDFTLETNLNSGQSAISREECERKFTYAINWEFEREMLKRELEIKQASFDKYFSEEEGDEKISKK